MSAQSSNLAPKVFLGIVDCLTAVDAREVPAEPPGAPPGPGGRFYGDFAPPPPDRDGGSGGLVLAVGGMRMSVPRMPEIEAAAPLLAARLRAQIAGGAAVPDAGWPGAYALFEEFMAHVACGWPALRGSFRKYSLEQCLELMGLAAECGAGALERAYARCAYEMIDRGNVCRVLRAALDGREAWLATAAFKCAAKDLEGVLASGGAGGEVAAVLGEFLKKLLGGGRGGKGRLVM
jgi:hypothetical protein